MNRFIAVLRVPLIDWGLRDYGTAQWEGGDTKCDHRAPDEAGNTRKPSSGQREHAGRFSGNECWRCGARRIDRQLGLEKTPEEYVARMVEVFCEVRRALRDDGVCFINLGDSYAGGGGFCPTAPSTAKSKSGKYGVSGALVRGGIKPRGEIKPKDLVGIPWMVAFALRADGWYLRQEIIWAKPNPMPESVTDRCTKSHESLFLLTKSAKYYFDAEVIKEPVESAKGNARSFRGGGSYTGGNSFDNGAMKERETHGNTENGTSLRNKRDVWTVATQPFPEAHFATFPPKLIGPCILAGCPPGGIVLDPFAGSGTTLLVAESLNCRGIGIELNPDYIEIAKRRLRQPTLAFGA